MLSFRNDDWELSETDIGAISYSIHNFQNNEKQKEHLEKKKLERESERDRISANIIELQRKKNFEYYTMINSGRRYYSLESQINALQKQLNNVNDGIAMLTNTK